MRSGHRIWWKLFFVKHPWFLNISLLRLRSEVERHSFVINQLKNFDKDIDDALLSEKCLQFLQLVHSCLLALEDQSV